MFARLQTVFETVAEGIVLQDEAGAIVEANPAASQLLGLTNDQLLGRSSVDARWRAVRVDGTDFPGSDHPAMVTLRTGEPQRGVIMGVHRPDGSLNWISINTARVEQGSQRNGVVSTFVDVTAQRNAEAEVVRAKEALNQLREIQALFIGGAPTERVCQALVALFLEASGSEYGFIAELREEAGTRFFQLHAVLSDSWSEEELSYYEASAGLGMEFLRPGAFFEAAAEGTVPRFANPATREDLAHGHLPDAPTLRNIAAIPIMVGGATIGMVGLANRGMDYDADVAADCGLTVATCGQILSAIRVDRERRRAIEDLRAAEERHDLILDATGIGRWDWNPTTDAAVFDRQWCHLVGYAESEIEGSGSRWLSLVHNEDLTAIDEALKAHLAGQTRLYRVEFRMKHKAGRWVWILALGRLIEHDAHGLPARMVGIHVDITRQKEVEAELAHSRDLSDRANRAKSEFLAAMSHEIRTPMNGVIGVAHLLLGTGLTAQQEEYAQTIRRSGEILLTLIDDILDFSKIEAGKLELESIDFDLRTTVAEVTDFVNPRIDEKGLELVVHWDCPPIPHFVGDPKRLRQVLINLCGNAAKFTERGGVTVRIERPAPDVLRFSVRDTGIGIPADKQQLIFEKFSQADSSTTRRFGGTGLGLAISRRLVEAMGGQIGVTSQPGEGSTFWFSLPVPNTPDVPAAVDELAGAHVILVADCAILAAAASALLGHLGVGHSQVNHPRDIPIALDGLPAGTHAIVVIDDQPAEWDTATAIRVTESRASVSRCRCIAITGARRRQTLQELLSGSRARILAKPLARIPVFTQALLDCVAELRDGPDSALEPVRLQGRLTGEQHEVRPTFEGVRVLIAEDNDVNRLVAEAMLQNLGCTVACAADGRQALEMVLAEHYDCVFMDCDMPEMDGFEATARIREDEGAMGRRVPIIALTANALVGDRERCIAAGMDDYLAKPIIPRDMEEMLARWVRANTNTQETRAAR
ncbi:MAG: PAS domain S-box protein [Gemmatimonadetes bacterium]|nr:PAS domain S-box protein [Gemmatimonadota bacterium]